MVKIKRNNTFLIIMFVFLIVDLLAYLPLFADYFRPDTEKVTAIVCTAITVLTLSIIIHYIEVSYREYELNDSGITIHCILHRTKHFSWEDYPYHYIMWLRSTGGKVHSLTVFSKTEIDAKQAKKIGNRGEFFSAPYSVITFQHTQELEEAIRNAFPDIHFVYLNTHLARREREGW